MRTRTVHPGPDADPDPAGSPTGQELVDDLEKVLAEEEAERHPPPGSKEDAWMMKVLEQATKVHYFAEEICNETTKEDWQPCAYQLYRWQMDQEVGHLYALFGGPEEDEVRMKGQRLAKVWMDRAMDGIERARKHVGLQFQGGLELDGPRQCHHDGPPMESRPCEIQAPNATRRANRAWRKGPRRVREFCGRLAGNAGESGEVSAPTEEPDGESESSLDSSDSESDTDCFESCEPHSPGPEEGLGPSGLKRGSSNRWRPSQQARDHPSPDHRKLNLRTLALPSPSQGTPTLSTWRQGGGARSPPARAIPIPPSSPPIRRSQARAAPTRVSRSHPRRTPRWTLLLRRHPWRRLRSSAGR